MQRQPTQPVEPAPDPKRVDAAIRHLESVARIVRDRRRAVVIPFPPRSQ